MTEQATAADATYTQPTLRTRLKEQGHPGVRGGKSGQWSARKAQLRVQHAEERYGKGRKAVLAAFQQRLARS